MCATYAPRDPIGEFWRGEISLRELRVLVNGLPDDSAVAQSDPDRAGWRVTEYLLADLYDVMNALLGLTGARYSGAESYKTPEPRKRPGGQVQATVRRRSAKVLRRVRELESILTPKR